MPAELMTSSVSMRPCSVSTAVTRRPFVSMPVAATPSITVAPSWRAPLAREVATPTGSARPSSATQKADSTSSVRASGHLAASSFAEISTSSTPKPCIQAPARRSASCRRWLVARER